MAEETKEQEEQPKGGKKKLIILLVVLLLLIGGGGGAAYKFLVLDKQKKNQEENKAEKIQEEIRNVENIGIMFEVGTFVVNLSDKDADRYLKVTVILEIENEQVKQEVEKRLPQIKDSITTLLLTKTSRELRTAEGVERLKEEILRRVNAILPLGGVKNVYFTDFVIQTA
ncbi:flagellar basal body-associated FliL family protein [Persephonella sp.]